MKRLCLSEETLAAYLSGLLTGEEKEAAEGHIASCDKCRKLLAEAHSVMSGLSMGRGIRGVVSRLGEYRWALPAVSFFVLSFLLPRFFLQFLCAAVIFALKWVFDSRTTRLLVMIKESLAGNTRGTNDKPSVHSRERGGD